MQRTMLNCATMRVADTTEVSGRVTADEANLDRFHNRISKVCTLVIGVITAFAVVSLSFSAQAAEKKKVTGTNKFGPPISRTVVPPGPGDDPKHELVVEKVPALGNRLSKTCELPRKSLVEHSRN